MTRRLAFVATVVGMLVAVPTPAIAFRHDQVHEKAAAELAGT